MRGRSGGLALLAASLFQPAASECQTGLACWVQWSHDQGHLMLAQMKAPNFDLTSALLT